MGYELIIVILLGFAVIYVSAKIKRAQQLAYVAGYTFHPALGEKLKEKYPHLSDEQIDMVFDGLRDYFYICNTAKKRMVSMPSQVVDVAWHEFILFTRYYKAFCKNALGRFLHHTPAEAMKTPTLAQEGIKRAWRLSCAKENVNPSRPSRLPLLFTIDGLLNIEDGFEYSLDCKDKSSPQYGSGYCASHVGCAAGCGGDSVHSSESGGLFDGIGDSSGCGGGGCGGD